MSVQNARVPYVFGLRRNLNPSMEVEMVDKIRMDRSGLPIGQHFRGCKLTVGSYLLRVQELFPAKPPHEQQALADGCWRRRMEAFRKATKAAGRGRK